MKKEAGLVCRGPSSAPGTCKNCARLEKSIEQLKSHHISISAKVAESLRQQKELEKDCEDYFSNEIAFEIQITTLTETIADLRKELERKTAHIDRVEKRISYLTDTSAENAAMKSKLEQFKRGKGDVLLQEEYKEWMLRGYWKAFDQPQLKAAKSFRVDTLLEVVSPSFPPFKETDRAPDTVVAPPPKKRRRTENPPLRKRPALPREPEPEVVVAHSPPAPVPEEKIRVPVPDFCSQIGFPLQLGGAGSSRDSVVLEHLFSPVGQLCLTRFRTLFDAPSVVVNCVVEALDTVCSGGDVYESAFKFAYSEVDVAVAALLLARRQREDVVITAAFRICSKFTVESFHISALKCSLALLVARKSGAGMFAHLLSLLKTPAEQYSWFKASFALLAVQSPSVRPDVFSCIASHCPAEMSTLLKEDTTMVARALRSLLWQAKEEVLSKISDCPIRVFPSIFDSHKPVLRKGKRRNAALLDGSVGEMLKECADLLFGAVTAGDRSRQLEIGVALSVLCVRRSIPWLTSHFLMKYFWKAVVTSSELVQRRIVGLKIAGIIARAAMLRKEPCEAIEGLLKAFLVPIPEDCADNGAFSLLVAVAFEEHVLLAAPSSFRLKRLLQLAAPIKRHVAEIWDHLE